MTDINPDPEEKRIRAEYGRRAADPRLAGRYSLFDPAALLHRQSIERNLLALLKRHGLQDLADRRVLDVGCGQGGHLRRLLDYGATPANLYGLDLLPERIEVARRLGPGLNWQTGSAVNLPYPDRFFDLVTVYVVFSSVLDDKLRAKIAGEMRRVLRPGGRIVWYDFAYSNPRNRQVRGVPAAEVRRLFRAPGAEFDLRRITLAPPLARRLAPRAYLAAEMLERLQLLNTHLIGLVGYD